MALLDSHLILATEIEVKRQSKLHMHAMASEPYQKHVTSWIFLLIAFTHMLSNSFVDGTRTSNSIMEQYSIEGEDGSVIDCVDIYKQPAFSHPLLKNHTLQLRPSSYPKGLKATDNTKILRDWNKNGKCPEGTIPIARTHVFKHPKVSPILPNRTLGFNSPHGHEYAQVYVEGTCYGAHAKVSVWNPATFNEDFSSAQFWVLAGYGKDLNSIEVGWQVVSSDNRPRIFIYWTRDNYQRTGCYNLKCPGFVQTSRTIALGSPISPISTYGGKQYDIEITIHKDKWSGNWWLQIEGEEVGYWPASILTSLVESSSLISWGGEIFDSLNNDRHTSTQMGSGQFPGEGFGKAGLIYDLGYIDYSGALKDAQYLIPYATKPSCYDIDMHVGEKRKYGLGVHFYFGGPGYSAQCP